METCNNCGETFDPGDLGQVCFHEQGCNNESLLEINIKGTKVEDNDKEIKH